MPGIEIEVLNGQINAGLMTKKEKSLLYQCIFTDHFSEAQKARSSAIKTLGSNVATFRRV